MLRILRNYKESNKQLKRKLDKRNYWVFYRERNLMVSKFMNEYLILLINREIKLK